MIVHVAEEALTAETFPRWISRLAGVDLSFDEFLTLNAIAFSVIVAGTVLAFRHPGGGWPLAALGTAVVTNALLHLGGTALTRSWSPGVVSATVLWLPLGVFALHWMWRRAQRVDLAIGLIVGFFAHGLVSLSLALP